MRYIHIVWNGSLSCPRYSIVLKLYRTGLQIELPLNSTTSFQPLRKLRKRETSGAYKLNISNFPTKRGEQKLKYLWWDDQQMVALPER